ncbi:cysteine desulfurase family protein [Novosphingobium sp.]|uniref:cysteine desulfurase family protein n=1 Tax=Novosphingobium sp. TaxID=1874826 RepID=UPI003D0E3DA5
MIYLDYQATTPLAPEALDAMLPWLGGPGSDGFANPHSPNRAGRAAAAAIEVAREAVAALLPPGGRVIFTSGATEALNMALRGAGKRRLAVSAIEHAAVLDTARAIDPALAVLPVDHDGLVDAAVAIPEGTGMVAVMQVNNEIGTVQPVDALARAAHAMGALFLCDAVQGAGKLAAPAGADLIAVSAHKLYGPKGIGALWVRDGVQVDPLITGGGQEHGARSGTLSPALAAGFGTAARLCVALRDSDAAHVDALWARARGVFAGWTLNGSATARWHGNLSVRVDGLDVARLLSECRSVAISAGSACASGSGRPSHVLRALGLSDRIARTALRIGFGRYTTVEDLEEALAAIRAAASAQGVGPGA